MAAGLRVDLDRWRQEFDELMLRVGGRFSRVEPRRRMAAFVRGLLAGLPRVNCWPIAEHAGEAGAGDAAAAVGRSVGRGRDA
jgi:hypothetical protein